MRGKYIIFISIFIIVYAFFVLSFNEESAYASDIIVASVFFFALFSGFFITKQNERYSKILEVVANRDAHFSFLYRVSGLIPYIQKEVRGIINFHYEEILKNNNWAYHEFNASTTLTDLTNAFGKLKKEDGMEPRVSTTYEVIWDSLRQLQQTRKQILFLFSQKLRTFQWVLLYVLAAILVFSFDLIASNVFFIDVIKIVFGTSVFLVLILLKQINDLSVFGKNFSKKLAEDVLRILDEKDLKEKGKQ